MDKMLTLIHSLSLHTQEPMTLRELAHRAAVPYTTALRIVNGHQELFLTRRSGNTRQVSLNRQDPIAKHYLIIAERRMAERFRARHPQIDLLVRDLPPGAYAVLLFGSRARETHRSQSDVDLCILDGATLDLSGYERLFKVSLNPIYLTGQEFRDMLAQHERSLAHEIMAARVTLYGEEHFWDVVWNG